MPAPALSWPSRMLLFTGASFVYTAPPCRPAILKAAGLFKEPRVVSEAVNLMAALEPPEVPAAAASRRPPNTIEPDVRSAVYAAAVRADGSREVFGTLQVGGWVGGQGS